MITNQGKPFKIFLADDDCDDCYLFQEALTEARINAKIVIHQDGENLMQYLSEVDERPDIIFLDVNMPRKNGTQCLKEIRSNQALKEVPVIMLSTCTHTEIVNEAFENGANRYVAKPVVFNDEVEILKRIFERNWQEELLKPDKNRFLLHAEAVRLKKLAKLVGTDF